MSGKMLPRKLKRCARPDCENDFEIKVGSRVEKSQRYCCKKCADLDRTGRKKVNGYSLKKDTPLTPGLKRVRKMLENYPTDDNSFIPLSKLVAMPVNDRFIRECNRMLNRKDPFRVGT